MLSMQLPATMAERIYTAVDVNNLFKSCREEFGENARVDFQVLSAIVPAKRHPEPVRQKLVAYTVSTPKHNHHVFSQVLQSFGYQIRERQMRHVKGLSTVCTSCGKKAIVAKPMHSDWDVGITVDAIEHIDSYDTFVLVSGDGDFVLLLDYLKSRGKKTVVLSFRTSTSQLLYTCADELHTLDKDIVFKLENRNGKE